MIIIRLLALAVWLLTVFALALDVLKMSDTGVFDPTALGSLWYKFDMESLTTAQNFVERYVSEFLWNPVIVTLLRMPSWVVLGGFAVILTVISAIGRGRKVGDRP